MTRNISIQSGRLYFSRFYKGQRYSGAFGLKDTPANRKKAELIAKKIGIDMELDSFCVTDYPMLNRNRPSSPPNALPTVATYADEWLDRVKNRLAASSFRDYRRQIVKYVVPFLGSTPINKIDRRLAEQWLSWLDGQISRTYAGDCLQRLKAIVRDAEDDYEFTSRVHRIKPFRSSAPANPKTDAIFSLDELARMYRVSGIRMRTMLLVSALAGLRPGEVAALKREDVDFSSNRLHVRANMADGQRVRPKTRAGVRWIEMHPFLRERLQEVLATHSSEYVFISQTGQPYWHRQSFADEFQRVKEKAKVPDLRWYALRKLFASIRFACSDLVPSNIAREMGHTKVAMSLDVYAEVLPHLGCKFTDLVLPIIPGDECETSHSQERDEDRKGDPIIVNRFQAPDEVAVDFNFIYDTSFDAFA